VHDPPSRPPAQPPVLRQRDRDSALFVALGGTSYAAITLPRNSVGNKQLRSHAVRSPEIRNRTIKLRDIATSARTNLRGQTGPPGPAGATGAPAISEHVRVDSGGDAMGGTTQRVTHTDASLYTIIFGRDVSACTYSATLARVPGGGVVDPPAGRITVASTGGPNVLVRTFDAAGTPIDLPFHLIVAC